MEEIRRSEMELGDGRRDHETTDNGTTDEALTAICLIIPLSASYAHDDRSRAV